MSSNSVPRVAAHSLIEDFGGLCTGAILIAIGLAFLKSAGLMTSGVSGVALLGHYATGKDAGVLLFFFNLPFYLLSMLKLGRIFTLKTLGVVSLVSVLTSFLPSIFEIKTLNFLLVGTFGGVVTGIGLLALFRHDASIGGTSVLAIVIQRWIGLSTGYVLFAFDVLIFGAAYFIIGPHKTLISLPGAIALNLMIAMNHKPGRYFGGHSFPSP